MPLVRPTTYEVKTDRGVLAVDVSGDQYGSPVVLLHGMPGAKSGPRPRSGVLYRLGVQLITYDRPGYGSSTRQPGRRVVDAAEDVAAIVEFLGIDGGFAVMGRSGGGPHALACAARMPRQVARVATLVCLAPPDAPGLDWFDGMTESNVAEFTAARMDAAALAQRLQLKADRAARNRDGMVDALRGEMTDPDRRFVDGAAMRRVVADNQIEALKAGAEGWLDDIVAIRNPWGFTLADISCPVRMWHGEDDKFSPVGHTRWLGEHIRECQVEIQTGTAHFGAVEAMMEMLGWLTDWDKAPAGRSQQRLERMRVDRAVQVIAGP